MFEVNTWNLRDNRLGTSTRFYNDSILILQPNIDMTPGKFNTCVKLKLKFILPWSELIDSKVEHTLERQNQLEAILEGFCL